MGCRSNSLLAVIFLGGSCAAQANLLANPSFESSLDSWQSSGNVAIRTADPVAYDGLNYIYGSNTALFSVWQDIDVLASGYTAGAVDSGALAMDFGGWQSGWSTQTDAGQITVRMLDAQMDEITHVSLDSFYSNKTWVEQSGTADLLSGTRYLRYEFVGTRHSGANNDAYLDAAYLNIRPVPEPETYALMLAGLIITRLAVRRRR